MSCIECLLGGRGHGPTIAGQAGSVSSPGARTGSPGLDPLFSAPGIRTAPVATTTRRLDNLHHIQACILVYKDGFQILSLPYGLLSGEA